MEWLNWSNAAYMAAIIIGGGLTFAAAKYKKVLKEIPTNYKLKKVSLNRLLIRIQIQNLY